MHFRRSQAAAIQILGPLFLLATLAASGFAETPAGSPGPTQAGSQPRVDYGRQIRPILAGRCGACHGAVLRKSGLRLDVPGGAVVGGDSGPAVVPGKSSESELVRRVTSSDPKHVMPPAGPRLTAREIELLRAWIDQGAGADARAERTSRSSDHWAFLAVRRPSVPRVRHWNWGVNSIDAFILAGLERRSEGSRLKPSPPADRVTLLRRLSFDLLGLPPTVQEVDAFLADRAAGAYERVVDRLLASPHYGERWGRHWLDAARYADSNGYTIDSERSIWKYRDWVIDALNRDMPFDQFTIEQIAGDLLPSAETEGSDGRPPSRVIATGFHRNTLINEEGGTDPEQFRVEAVVDRVNTTGTVWLGLTVGCAQCHTHKYDPITQREYYQLFAFFNNADEPALPFPTPEQALRQRELKGRVSAAQQKLQAHDAAQPERQPAWEQRVLRDDAIDWVVLEPIELKSAGGATLTRLADGSVLSGGKIPDHDTYTIAADVPRAGITAVRLEALTHPSLPKGGPGWAGGNFLLTDFALSLGEKPIPVIAAVADHSQKDYPVSLAVDSDPKTGWAINVMPGEGSLNSDRTALFLLKEPLPLAARIAVTLRHDHPNKRYLIGRWRLSVTSAPAADLGLPAAAALRKTLAVPAGERTPEERARVSDAFRAGDLVRASLAGETSVLEGALKELEKAIVTTMVVKERETARATHVHLRGDFLRKGQPVRPDVPEALPPLHAGAANPTRLDLARWLVDPRNPLTARVTVNRVWQAYFGTGLVETENDFGTQGARPSHPELLDYLASEFVRSRWSLKALHRLIVTSATYRQSSRARPELQAVDPNNRLLGRQSRLRLEAEVLRDTALAASGLLSRKIGGPSVFPPQPEGLDLFTQNKKNWRVSPGEDRYRRGMYTFLWRTSPYAMFATFDAPNAAVTCTRRTRSNTPLGALMLANDQAFVEAAQALATRTLREAQASVEARVRYAFRCCLSREPTSAERDRLINYFEAQLRAFSADAASAAAAAPADRPADVSPAEAAAWTAAARVLMNLDEFIVRE